MTGQGGRANGERGREAALGQGALERSPKLTNPRITIEHFASDGKERAQARTDQKEHSCALAIETGHERSPLWHR